MSDCTLSHCVISPCMLVTQDTTKFAAPCTWQPRLCMVRFGFRQHTLVHPQPRCAAGSGSGGSAVLAHAQCAAWHRPWSTWWRLGYSTLPPYPISASALTAGGTRTCIHTPGEPLDPAELALPCSRVRDILDGAALVYFDGRLAEAALLLAEAARARRVPVLVEGERLRPGLDELLAAADFVTTSAHFPQVLRRHSAENVCVKYVESGADLGQQALSRKRLLMFRRKHYIHCSPGNVQIYWWTCCYMCGLAIPSHAPAASPQAWTGEAELGDCMCGLVFLGSCACCISTGMDGRSGAGRRGGGAAAAPAARALGRHHAGRGGQPAGAARR